MGLRARLTWSKSVDIKIREGCRDRYRRSRGEGVMNISVLEANYNRLMVQRNHLRDTIRELQETMESLDSVLLELNKQVTEAKVRRNAGA